jgi:hypothetical protein
MAKRFCPRHERAREREGRLPFLRGEVGVARADCEPVGVANRRDDANFELQVQIGDQAFEDRGLLRVLLAEVGPVRPDDVEELEADRRHSAEVPGTGAPFQLIREAFDLHPGPEALRIHLLGGRDEQVVDPRGLRERGVGLFVARVALEVLPLPELGRVDEDRGDDDVVLPPGGLEERHVARVQRAHRGDEAHALGGKCGAGLRDGAQDLHRELAPRSAASVSASAR